MRVTNSRLYTALTVANLLGQSYGSVLANREEEYSSSSSASTSISSNLTLSTSSRSTSVVTENVGPVMFSTASVISYFTSSSLSTSSTLSPSKSSGSISPQIGTESSSTTLTSTQSSSLVLSTSSSLRSSSSPSTSSDLNTPKSSGNSSTQIGTESAVLATLNAVSTISYLILSSPSGPSTSGSSTSTNIGTETVVSPTLSTTLATSHLTSSSLSTSQSSFLSSSTRVGTESVVAAGLNTSSESLGNQMLATPSTNPASISPTRKNETSTSVSPTALITPVPSLIGWGNQSIPLNTCQETIYDNKEQWESCTISAGTVTVSYFPVNSGNFTYPSTYYNPQLSIVMTSPSIYMVVESITAHNRCGKLGPSFTNVIIPMDPSELSTLPPFLSVNILTTAAAQPLNLNDFNSNCNTKAYSGEVTAGRLWKTHPVENQYDICNPRISWPPAVISLGGEYWASCNTNNALFGMFDPPSAVPPVQELLTKATPIIPTPTPAAIIAGIPAIQPQNTNIAASPDQTATISAPLVQAGLPSDISASVQPAISQPVTQPGTAIQSVVPPNQPQTASQLVTASVQLQAPAMNGDSSTLTQEPLTPSIIAIVNGSTITAQAGFPSVILPNGNAASVGSVVTVSSPDNNNVPAIVSVGSSGIFVDSYGTSSTFFLNPVATDQSAAPLPIATIAGQVISVAPGANSVIIGSQTVQIGGGPVTIAGSNAVATLGSSGLIIQNPGGEVSSYAIPTVAPSPALTPAPLPIATVGGQVVSAAPGANSVIIGSQTVQIGGAPVTLAGTNIVATLGGFGLIVQNPGGAVSTYVIPTTTPSSVGSGSGISVAAVVIGTVGGTIISATPGASYIVVGSQILTSGGSPITLAGSEVLNMEPSAIIVQSPGGIIQTLALPIATLPTNPASIGVAGIIASIIGATKNAPTPTVSAALETATSLAGIVAVESSNVGTTIVTVVAPTNSNATSTQPSISSAIIQTSTATKSDTLCMSIMAWFGGLLLFTFIT